MIVRLAERLALLTKEYNPDMPRSIGALTYQYAILINTAAVVALTLIIGYFDGRIGATAAVMAAFMALRMVSGGYHFKSLDICVVVTVIIFAGIPLIPEMNTNVYIVLNAVTAVIAAARSPTSLPEGTVNKRRHGVWLKAASVVVVAVGSAVNSPAVTLSLFVQALTLLYTRKEVDNR